MTAHSHIAHRPLGGDSWHRAWLAVVAIPVLVAVTFLLAHGIAAHASPLTASWGIAILCAGCEIVPIVGTRSALKAATDDRVDLGILLVVLNFVGAALIAGAAAAGGLTG